MSHTLSTKIKKFHDQWLQDNGYDMTELLCNYRLYEKSYKNKKASSIKLGKHQAPSSESIKQAGPRPKHKGSSIKP